MTLNIIRPESMPARPYPDELYNFSITAIPALQYGIWLKSQPYYWLSDDDTLKARSVLSEVGAALLMPIGRDLINQNDRLYNLLDLSLRGVARTVVGDGTTASPFVYDPVIPQTPDLLTPYGFTFTHPSMMNWANSINQTLAGFDTYLEAALLGDPDQGIDVSHTTYGQLDRIETAIEAMGGDTGDKIDTIISDLELLALLLGV